MAALRRRMIDRLPEGSRGGLRRARRAMRELQGKGVAGAKPSVPLTGVVERVGETQISGWVMVPTDTPPTPVTLHLGPIQLSSTYPTPDGALAGMRVTKEDEAAPSVQEAATHQRNVGSGVAAGRADGRRNVREGFEARAFSFQVKEIWAYLRKGDRLAVRYAGQPLPITGHGIFLRAATSGKFDLATLQQRLDEGHILTQTGRIMLSKRLDEEWQRRVAALYAQVRDV